MSDGKTISFEEHTKVQQQLQAETERRQRNEAEAVDLKKQLERFKDIDPDKYKAIVEDYDNLRKEAAKGDDKKIDQLLADREKTVRGEVQKKVDDLSNENKTLKSSLKELRIVDRVHGQIAKHFNDDVQEDVKARIRAGIDLTEDGNFVVKNEKGEPRYSSKDATKLMSVDEFAEELQTAKPSWCKPTHVSGGMQAGTKTNGTMTVNAERYLKMTDAERQKLSVKERGDLANEVMRQVPAMQILRPAGR